MTDFQRWNVYVNNRKVDSAFYLKSMSREHVTNDLQAWAPLYTQKGTMVVRKARK